MNEFRIYGINGLSDDIFGDDINKMKRICDKLEKAVTDILRDEFKRTVKEENENSEREEKRKKFHEDVNKVITDDYEGLNEDTQKYVKNIIENMRPARCRTEDKVEKLEMRINELSRRLDDEINKNMQVRDRLKKLVNVLDQ